MKIALISDTHLHFSPYAGSLLATEMADVVVLAGDIGAFTFGLHWAGRHFLMPVIYVAGNHEYYGTNLGLLAEMRDPEWKQQGVHFLEQESIEIGGVRFLGCTLWSDFGLYGNEEAQDAAMAAAGRYINDYRLIRTPQGARLTPQDTLTIHRDSVAWLDAELAKPFAGRTVVITHFAPHPQCVAPLHQGNELSPYFVTDLRWLMEKHAIDVWCYGHTHTNISFQTKTGGRVFSNQVGYPQERATIGFDKTLIIEV